ncbi:MAG TPA: HVO_2922 family protein [Natrialbaceae archaeon]|nr:HVO_2922 family protein [Natrialbaceae archaeon]
MPNEPRFEVYRDNANEWRWRLVAANGHIIAASGEGYRSKQGVKRGIESVKKSAPEAEILIRNDD